jgi:hypothetical protein
MRNMEMGLRSPDGFGKYILVAWLGLKVRS